MNSIDIFPWDENFNTGVDIIDQQHRVLVSLLNRLSTQVAYESINTSIDQIFDELIDYTVYHFETEEALWNKYFASDPLDEKHQIVHKTFVDKVLSLKEQQKTRPLMEIAEDALEFLANWLASHILVTDRHMAYVILEVENGTPFQEAKIIAQQKIDDSSKTLVKIILSTYSSLSKNTIHLIKELKINKKFDDRSEYEDKYRKLLLDISTLFINLPLEKLSVEINAALKKMANFVGADRAYIFEYNYKRSSVSNTYEWCAQNVPAEKKLLQNISFTKCAFCSSIFKAKGNILIHNVLELQDDAFKDFLLTKKIQSLITLPLFSNANNIGFIGFETRKTLHAFTENEIEILTLFSKLLANVYDRTESEKSLHLAASVFQNSREGIMITSEKNRIIDINQAVTDITGYKKEELLDQNPKILSSSQNSSLFYEKMWQELNQNDYWSGEIWNRHKNGSFYAEMLTITAVRGPDKKIINYLGLFSDITPLKKQQKHLEYIAHYDSLTGLANRVLLTDRLKQAMIKVNESENSLAVVYLDLDGFKNVNDSYGHNYGDKLLSILGEKMKHGLRSGDTIARLGGDEFVAVFTNLKTHEECLPMLRRLLISVAEPVSIDDISINISASLGVAFYDGDEAIEADQLLRQADQAMYQAKLSGKNRYHFFDSIEDETIRSHHEQLDTIEKALKNREFTLYYQPKVNMHLGDVIGFEALIRWNHPTRGVLSPAEFLPVIENNPLSIDVGEWVIEEACKQILLFKEQNLNLNISVNINALHLLMGNFTNRLSEILQKYPSIQKGDLTIEILETSAIEDLKHVSNIIKEAQTLGVGFSLDDFGTGYSSLTYLKQLSVEELKIDQSFIRDMLHDPDDLAIIKGIITLANAFNRDIIAEGVESIEHGETLLGLGCTIAQGYIIARPMPAEEISKWLQEYRPNQRWQEALEIRQKS